MAVSSERVCTSTSNRRLRVVRGDRPAAGCDQRAQRGDDLRVGEHVARDPHHVGGPGIGDEREPVGDAVFARGDRERCRDGRHGGEGGNGGRRVGDRSHLGLEHVGRGTGDGLDVAAQHAERLVEAVVQRAELEEVEETFDLGRVGRTHAQIGRLQVDRRIAHEQHHALVAAHPLLHLGVGQAGPQLRRLLVEVLEDPLDAPVGVDQLRSGLLADPGDAGKVVAVVTAERGVGHVQRRRHAGPLEDAGFVVERVVADAATVVEHLDERVLDELVAVTVAGDDDGLDAFVAGARGERGDDVVGFVAGQLDHRHRQRGEHLANQPHLLAQDVGRRGAVRLVGVDRLVAERRLGPVERDGDVVGLVVAQQVDEHRREAEHGVGHLARRRRHVGRQREERPVRERVPVDEHQLGHGANLRRTAGGWDHDATNHLTVTDVLCTELASVTPAVNDRELMAPSRDPHPGCVAVLVDVTIGSG
jgi:hypothetical protein